LTAIAVDYSDRLLTIADLRFDPPNLLVEAAQQLALTHFGVVGEFSALAGERDQNFRVRCADGRQYVFKISGSSEPDEVVEMQVQALSHIAQRDSDLPVPRVIPGLDGRLICHAHHAGTRHALRLLSWLPGWPYQEGPFPSSAGLRDLGGFIARLGKSLEGFDHPAARHFMPWSLANGLVFSKQLKSLLPAQLGGWLPDYLEHLQSDVYPRLMAQRQQMIHQDGHGGNLLRSADSGEAVSGVIDFGDMIYGPLICDLAACVSDFLEAADDPVVAAGDMCAGYHAVLPLQEEELELLLDLVMTRQIMTLQLFEFRRLNMENPPSFVTDEQPGFIASLQQLARLDKQDFAQHMKEAVRNA